MTYYKSLLVILLLIGLAGCATTKGDWKKAQELNTVSSYQEFLSKHQNSEYNVQAKTRIEELDWEKAQQENTVDAYQGYLRKYPQGRFDQDAKSRIEELDCRSTTSTNTAESYQAFISKYPKSKMAPEAKSRIEKLEWKDAERGNTIESYENFLRKHPNSEFAAQASERLEQFENKEVEKLREQNRKSSVDAKKKIIPVFAYRETVGEPHFIFKGLKGQYFKVTRSETKEYQNGLDVPYLKYAKPHEAVVLYISLHDIIGGGIKRIIENLMMKVLKEFAISESEGKILLLSSNEDKDISKFKKGETYDLAKFLLFNITNVDSLISDLKGNDPIVRKDGVVALGIIGDERAIEALIKVPEFDNDPDTREKAVKSLESIATFLRSIGDVRGCEILWHNVTEKDDLKSYDIYIKECPKGAVISEAKKKHERLMYLDTISKNSYLEYDEFIKQYPNSIYIKDVQERMNQDVKEQMNQFGKVKELFVVPKDTFISHQDLVKRYHWNESHESFIWGHINGEIRINEHRNQVLIGQWAIGNLKFSGSVTWKAGGLELAKDTIIIYPVSNK